MGSCMRLLGLSVHLVTRQQSMEAAWSSSWLTKHEAQTIAALPYVVSLSELPVLNRPESFRRTM